MIKRFLIDLLSNNFPVPRPFFSPENERFASQRNFGYVLSRTAGFGRKSSLLVSKSYWRTGLILVLVSCFLFTSVVQALSPEQRRVFNSGILKYDIEALACSPLGANYATGGLGETLEGHTLPASSGGVGLEEVAEIADGRARLVRNKANLALAPRGMTAEDAKFYIAMRWRYALWAWDGTSRSSGAPEDGKWYTDSVRKVLVTNPETGKGVVASILESGPAPWTGTPEGSAGKNNPPAYWQGYVDGTPDGYNGRVAGLAPAAMDAIGGSAIQWERGSGVALQFSWADQNMAAGTVVENGQVSENRQSANMGCVAGQPAGIENFVFYSQYDPRWKDYSFGSSTIGPSGCGPASVAMVVATLADSSITPKETADYGTQQGYYIEEQGSSWAFFSEGVKNWGLSSQEIGTDFSAARDAIRNGSLVIVSGKGPMPFTTGGHILVIRGVDEKGDFLLGDPQEQNLNDTPYSESSLAGSVRNMWVISK